MSKFGLIGKNIDYSFSKKYFTEKFERENLPHSYENFDIPFLENFPKVISETSNLKGLNVTIPYKEEIIPLLDNLDNEAIKIGAVNTIKISEERKLTGYNTDHYGFQKSLEIFLPLQQKTALILGTGGASKAVAYALGNLGFNFNFVSRKSNSNSFVYSELNQAIINNHLLIVNCTPLGTFPNIEACPPIPYHYLTKHHLLFDLIYNPSETEFLKRGKLKGTQTANGLKMLELQAEKAWEIWNS
ncbi:shikimate dehydrogenase family protein [Aequorivita lipolytica]|uniref:Shikimate dehydrogenase n=1 Tax=Aequorivita lipolytica TaxID=153267 RepID=A0A5C6YMQ2_9FLAO|nr:shikimate dehydrogenase [Aequorivita lipolytica]TXD68840.1 shikimate dehydrogenase [Aequorivita lipolytica]SRX52098.1 Shikimate dehydrogenase (NADP(+)) [Aequorivita lipolytica]